jgi:hypothetical protein
MEQGGFRLQVPKPELYYELLPAYHVKVHPGRGVKIHGLWYGKASPALQDCQGPSGRGGTHKNEWVIRADRRDLRQVFLQDPADPSQWHVLRWNKMPPEGEIPAFSDKTAEELLAAARQHGLSPWSDDEQLPELLRLLGGVAPVSQWATQLGKKEKKSRARQAAQGDQATADRNGPAAAASGRMAEDGTGNVVSLRWPAQAAQARDAVNAERRRRREAAVTQRPAPPPSLGDRLRATSMLSIPDEEDE